MIKIILLPFKCNVVRAAGHFLRNKCLVCLLCWKSCGAQEELARRVELLENGLQKNSEVLEQKEQELVEAHLALKAQVRKDASGLRASEPIAEQCAAAL